MRASTVYVTGARGFLGRELLRLSPSALHQRVEVRDHRALEELFTRTRPDVVIHAASRQDGDEAWSINVDGSQNIARYAAAVGARLVHMSTDVVFDGRKGHPYIETDGPNPQTAYGRSKAEAERRVTQQHPGALLVRTSLIYGGPGHGPSKHELVARHPDATFYDDELRCPIQVGDLAAALLELARSTCAGPLHVAGAHAVSRAEFAELVAQAPVQRQPTPPGRPLDCRLDSSRAGAQVETVLRGVHDVLGASPAARRER